MLNVFQLNSAFLNPKNHGTTDVIGALDHDGGFWPTKLFNNLIQSACHALRGQRKVNFENQCFTVKVVDLIKQSDVSAIGQLILHEINLTHAIESQWFKQWFRLLPHQALLLTKSEPIGYLLATTWF